MPRNWMGPTYERLEKMLASEESLHPAIMSNLPARKLKDAESRVHGGQ